VFYANNIQRCSVRALIDWFGLIGLILPLIGLFDWIGLIGLIGLV
jgi:hypothetical protein